MIYSCNRFKSSCLENIPYRLLGTVQKFFYGFMMEFSVLLTPAHKHTQVHVPIFTFTSRKWIRVQYQTVQVQRDFLLAIY